MSSLKSIFQSQPGLKTDQRLVKAIHDFERGFANGSEEHIAFFGGHTMGVHKMRFKTSDREKWFEDVLQADEVMVEDEVLKLPTIKEEWARASDTMNLSCAYLIYAIRNDAKLSQSARQSAATSVALVMLYKFLGSLMAHYYPYTADEATMNATYESLSKKFALKKAGSWAVLLRERAEELVSPRSVHRKVFERFDDDEAVVRMINDTQSRLRKIVKTMTAVFYEFRAKGVKIETERTVMDIEGETILKDKSRRYSSYIRYLQDTMGDQSSFIREELVKVITDMMHTMSPRNFRDTLVWISKNQRTKEGEVIDRLAEETLLYAFDLISTNRSTLGGRGDLPALLTRLRALYMASRMSDASLLACKEMAENIVKRATGSKSSSAIAGVRTGLQLYLVLRAMAMNHYQN